jgi:hypothetical protein
MVDSRRTSVGQGAGEAGNSALAGASARRSGAPSDAPRRHRDRFPSLQELAALMVDGVLRLPQRYRRGMFLDLIS